MLYVVGVSDGSIVVDGLSRLSVDNCRAEYWSGSMLFIFQVASSVWKAT